MSMQGQVYAESATGEILRLVEQLKEKYRPSSDAVSALDEVAQLARTIMDTAKLGMY